MLPAGVLLGKLSEGRSNLGKVLNVASEEIAQAEELMNLLNISGRLSLLYGL